MFRSEEETPECHFSLVLNRDSSFQPEPLTSSLVFFLLASPLIPSCILSLASLRLWRQWDCIPLQQIVFILVPHPDLFFPRVAVWAKAKRYTFTSFYNYEQTFSVVVEASLLPLPKIRVDLTSFIAKCCFYFIKLIMFMISNILKVYCYTVNKNKLLINLIYQKIVSVKAHVNQHHHIKTNKKSLSAKQNKQ